MKKIDLGQTISILANIGVIAGIVFLAYELRQNTRVSRAAAVQSISDQTIEWQTALAQDSDWMRIIAFLVNGGSYHELSPEDTQRFRYVASSTIRIMENRYRQVQLGILDPSELDASGGRGNVAWFRSPYFLDFWQSYDQAAVWAPDFIEFMESEVLGIR